MAAALEESRDRRSPTRPLFLISSRFLLLPHSLLLIYAMYTHTPLTIIPILLGGGKGQLAGMHPLLMFDHLVILTSSSQNPKIENKNRDKPTILGIFPSPLFFIFLIFLYTFVCRSILFLILF